MQLLNDRELQYERRPGKLATVTHWEIKADRAWRDTQSETEREGGEASISLCPGRAVTVDLIRETGGRPQEHSKPHADTADTMWTVKTTRTHSDWYLLCMCGLISELFQLTWRYYWNATGIIRYSGNCYPLDEGCVNTFKRLRDPQCSPGLVTQKDPLGPIVPGLKVKLIWSMDRKDWLHCVFVFMPVGVRTCLFAGITVSNASESKV